MTYKSDVKTECIFEDKGRVLWRSRFNTAWLRKPQVILDIGAYDGGDSIRFAKAFPDCRVYSFEGCPGRNAILSQYLNEYPNIIHLPYAVSDTLGKIDWYSAACRNDAYGAQGSILKHTDVYKNTFDFVKQADPIKVDAITVSYVCGSADVDLAHIDVEGAEIYVVNGFGNCRPKLVWLETILDDSGWEDCTNRNELHIAMTEMGYVLAHDFGDDRLYEYKAN